ncbi:mechanosensitive ion channel family protein [Corynebacterium mendelii]
MPFGYLLNVLWRWIVEIGIPLGIVLILALLVPRIGRFAVRFVENRVNLRSQEAKAQLALAGTGVYLAQIIIYVVLFVIALKIFGLSGTGVAVPATVVSAALGFGAQSIIADFLAGFFILTEKQFGLGDWVRFQGNGIDVQGDVMKITMRATHIRTLGGENVIIPNSTARVCYNHSNNWARAVVVIPVPLLGSESMAEVVQRCVAAGKRALADPVIADDVMGELEVHPPVGITQPTAVGQPWMVNMRFLVRTFPLCQWSVERTLRTYVVDEFFADYGSATTYDGYMREEFEPAPDRPVVPGAYQTAPAIDLTVADAAADAATEAVRRHSDSSAQAMAQAAATGDKAAARRKKLADTAADGHESATCGPSARTIARRAAATAGFAAGQAAGAAAGAAAAAAAVDGNADGTADASGQEAPHGNTPAPGKKYSRATDKRVRSAARALKTAAGKHSPDQSPMGAGQRKRARPNPPDPGPGGGIALIKPEKFKDDGSVEEIPGHTWFAFGRHKQPGQGLFTLGGRVRSSTTGLVAALVGLMVLSGLTVAPENSDVRGVLAPNPYVPRTPAPVTTTPPAPPTDQAPVTGSTDTTTPQVSAPAEQETTDEPELPTTTAEQTPSSSSTTSTTTTTTAVTTTSPADGSTTRTTTSPSDVPATSTPPSTTPRHNPAVSSPSDRPAQPDDNPRADDGQADNDSAAPAEG